VKAYGASSPRPTISGVHTVLCIPRTTMGLRRHATVRSVLRSTRSSPKLDLLHSGCLFHPSPERQLQAAEEIRITTPPAEKVLSHSFRVFPDVFSERSVEGSHVLRYNGKERLGLAFKCGSSARARRAWPGPSWLCNPATIFFLDTWRMGRALQVRSFNGQSAPFSVTYESKTASASLPSREELHVSCIM
jgi:hypothetical protein